MSCNKDETFVDETAHHALHDEGPQGFISFSKLIQSIGESPEFKENLDYFDVNRGEPIAGRGTGFVDAYIDTNNIHLIETENTNYYTLKLINNNPAEKTTIFYNLVFEQNLQTGEVTSSILQYSPDLSWLFDKTDSFKGNIKMFENSLITLEDLNNGLIINDEGRSGAPCISSLSSYWFCPIVGHPNPRGCTAGAWQYTINTDTEPCGGGGSGSVGGSTGGGDTGGGDNGDNNNDNGTSGGSGSGGGGGGNFGGTTQTVVLELCNDFLPDGDTDSEDCVEDYAAAFMPFLCNTNSSSSVINTWGENNQQDANDLYNFLINNYPNPTSSNCVEIETYFDRINGDEPPSCEAFEFNDVIPGVPGWQSAGVKNIAAGIAVLNAQTGDLDIATIFFPQPIYFEMPRFSEINGGLITSGRAAELSSDALYTAIQRTKYYFLATSGSNAQVQSKLWEYLRDEMQNGVVIGGKAGFVPSNGFNGSITDYKAYWFLPDNCD